MLKNKMLNELDSLIAPLINLLRVIFMCFTVETKSETKLKRKKRCVSVKSRSWKKEKSPHEETIIRPLDSAILSSTTVELRIF